MPSLKEYFKNDFRDLSLDSDLTMTMKKPDANGLFDIEENITIERKVRVDMYSSCQLFTFYVPKKEETLSIIGNLLENFAGHQESTEKVLSFNSYENDVLIGSCNIVCSNRIYFYTESQLTEEEVNSLDSYCKKKNLLVTVRSQNYVKLKMEKETPLAFISHDSRNKAEIAEPLANGLSSRMCSIWYDEFSLRVGQSLRESIEKGIKEAKKCILILTPEFLQNPGWTKKEFNSIFTREMIFNEKVVLPIWYNVSKKDIYNYSPSLADTVALVWPSSTNLSEGEYEKEVQKLISKIHTAVTE